MGSMKYEEKWCVLTQYVLKTQLRIPEARGAAKPSFLSRALEDLAMEGRENPEELRRLEFLSWDLYGGKICWHNIIILLAH